MKELDNHNKLSEKQSIEAVVKKKQQIELKYIGSLKPKSKSHNLYEINTKTLEIKLASYKTYKEITWEQALKMVGGSFRDELVINKDCVYISALNPDNALKRYKEGKGSAELEQGILKL